MYNSRLQNKDFLFERIKKEGFKNTSDLLWLTPSGQSSNWAFDLKSLFLDKQFLTEICEAFWNHYGKSTPLQIGGMETASIPLIAALVLSGDNATGFYIRKSRKKKYDLREIEGSLSDKPIILVDDVLNSGSSITKQIKILQKYKRDVSGVFCCVTLQSPEYYNFLKNYGITLMTLFDLKEFDIPYPTKKRDFISFIPQWEFSISKPHVFKVERRQQSFLGEFLYLNADDGVVYALEPHTGDVAWQKRIQWSVPKNSNQPGLIQSKDLLCAASENGIVHALNPYTGATLWANSFFDTIKYQPKISQTNSYLLISGQNGPYWSIVCVDPTSGKKLWEYQCSSPVSELTISEKYKMVFFGTKTGELYALRLRDGHKIWMTQLDGHINDAPTLYMCSQNKKVKIAVVTTKSKLYCINPDTGVTEQCIVVTHEENLSASPIIEDACAYITSLHKTVYCVDLVRASVLWEFNTRGRIFVRPVIFKDIILIGNNEGIIYALDKQTGEKVGSYIGTERIVAELWIDNQHDVLYVSTINNAITALSIEDHQDVKGEIDSDDLHA